MLGWSLTFAAAALLVGSFGFGFGRSTALTLGMAKALFFIFASLAIVAMMSRTAFGY